MEARAERKANATLIASAPDLLEALKNLLSEFLSRTALIESCDMDEDEEAAIEAAESAISKATNTTP